jgi:FKBP-type peptidyl-prolyl cis-trans isomerase (trigger factor)
MTKLTRIFGLTIWLLGAFSISLIGSLSGCMNSESNSDHEPLIRVQDRILTVLDFNKEFEISRTAYPHNFKDDPENFRNARLRLLNQLVVEMIILERAEELGLSISSEEINKAVSEIKSDYPEDTFEKALLEYAVSYDAWEARLKTRLLMQKVVDNELKDQITITPEDIASYYEKNYQATDSDAEPVSPDEDINENIIKHLRQEKAERAYKIWIKELKGKYSIEINDINWEKLSGSKYQEGQELENEDPGKDSG